MVATSTYNVEDAITTDVRVQFTHSKTELPLLAIDFMEILKISPENMFRNLTRRAPPGISEPLLVGWTWPATALWVGAIKRSDPSPEMTLVEFSISFSGLNVTTILHPMGGNTTFAMTLSEQASFMHDPSLPAGTNGSNILPSRLQIDSEVYS
eukprot:gene18182-21659_t